VPEGIRKVFSECMYLAQRLNELESDLNVSGPSARLDAFERILAEFRQVNLPLYLELCSQAVGDSKYRKAQLLAFERANFRCVICKHSDTNSGALEGHHILPRSHAMLAREVVGDLHSHRNIAPLCHQCHDKVTNPPDPRWKWRNIAPRLFELIGEPDLANKMRNYQNVEG